MTNTGTTTVRINRAPTVHVAWLYSTGGGIIGTVCGSDGRNGRAPHYRPTTDEVTCKKCLTFKP